MAIRVRHGGDEAELPDMAALRDAVSRGRLAPEDEFWDPIRETWQPVGIVGASPAVPQSGSSSPDAHPVVGATAVRANSSRRDGIGRRAMVLVIGALVVGVVVLVVLLVVQRMSSGSDVAGASANKTSARAVFPDASTAAEPSLAELAGSACQRYASKEKWLSTCLEVAGTKSRAALLDAADVMSKVGGAGSDGFPELAEELLEALTAKVAGLIEDATVSAALLEGEGPWCSKAAAHLADTAQLRDWLLLPSDANRLDAAVGMIALRLYVRTLFNVQGAYAKFLVSCDPATTCHWMCVTRLGEEMEELSHLLSIGAFGVRETDQVTATATFGEATTESTQSLVEYILKLNRFHGSGLTLTQLRRDLVNYEGKKVIVRAFAWPTDYYNYNFSSPRRWKGYGLADECPMMAVRLPEMYAYVDRSDHGLLDIVALVDVSVDGIDRLVAQAPLGVVDCTAVAVTAELLVPSGQSSRSTELVQLLRLCPTFVSDRFLQEGRCFGAKEEQAASPPAASVETEPGGLGVAGGTEPPTAADGRPPSSSSGTQGVRTSSGRPDPTAVASSAPQTLAAGSSDMPAAGTAGTPAPPSAPSPGPSAPSTGSTPAAGGAQALPESPTRTAIRQGVDPIKQAIQACGAGQTGTIVIEFTLSGSTGAVSGARATGDFAGTRAGTCAEGVARRAVFEPFRRSTFTFTFPFVLPIQ